MDQSQQPVQSIQPQPTEQKKLRKGTHSCWECKRRKRRCTFSIANGRTCTNCQRRGLPCFGQEVPETDVLAARKGKSEISEQLSRVENILHDVLDRVQRQEVGEQQQQADVRLVSSAMEMNTPTESTSSATPEAATPLAIPAVPRHVSTPGTLISTLLSALPNDEDYKTLIVHGHGVTLSFYELNTGGAPKPEQSAPLTKSHCKTDAPRPYQAESSQFFPATCVVPPMPDASVHPVLLARQMMYWALFLQSPWHHRGCHFLENSSALMERLVAAAQRVNGLDELHGSVESLETIMLESQYHLNGGRLRRSWLTNRKAMLLAQLTGVHRAAAAAISNPLPGPAQSRHRLRTLQPQNHYRPDAIWGRIVFVDRFLSLLLGLPPGSTEGSAASRILHMPMSQMSNPCVRNMARLVHRLEYVLSGVAARILERNEKGVFDGLQDGMQCEEDSMTTALDTELLEAAQSLPTSFWQLPSFANVTQYTADDAASVGKLVVQVYHFHLLSQLHLPYMLSFLRPATILVESDSVPIAPPAAISAPISDYACISCTSASRAILQRFIAYRRFNHTALCFRPVDFAAVTAVLTLLLAHLDAHQQKVKDRQHSPSSHRLLAHQRAGDRSLLEDALERLDAVSQYNRDVMSSESTRLMRALLAVEACAAAAGEGKPPSPPSPSGKADNQVADGGVLQITIPFFGSFCVSPDGRISSLFPADDDDNDNTVTPAAETDHSEPKSYWAKQVDRAPEGVFDACWLSGMPGMSRLTHLPSSLSGMSPGLPFGLTTAFPPVLASNFSIAPHTLSSTAAQAVPVPSADWSFTDEEAGLFDNLLMGPAWQGP